MSILNGPEQEAATLARAAVKAASDQNRDVVLSNLSIAQALLAIATAIRESGTPGDLRPDPTAAEGLAESIAVGDIRDQKGPSLAEQIRIDLREKQRRDEEAGK